MHNSTQVKRRCVLVFAATSLIGMVACNQQQSLPAASIQTVGAAYVEQIVPETKDRYSATISPFTQVDLSFKSPGIVQSIRQVRGSDGRIRSVNTGDLVTQGTALAFVRAADYEHAVSQAESQVVQAQAQLDNATASQVDAQLNYERSRNLFQSASLVKPSYDQAKASYDSAQAMVDGAKAGLANARVALAQAKLSLSDTVIRAPFSGWITARNLEVGTLASSGAVAFSMVDAHLAKAVFDIPDIALQSVHLGAQYELLLDAVASPVRAIVTSIAQQADSKTHVFAVELTIPNPGDLVRPGMIGSLTLVQGQSKGPRLVIPLSAMVRPPGRSTGFAVFKLEDRDGKTYARSQDIEIGETYGNSVEVTKGLVSGERIIGMGGSLARDGQEVRVLR